MKLKVVEYFIAVAEAGSINAAAQKLYIAQPSLTKALKTMEDELGTRLFIRTSTGIRLTEAGQIILPQAKQMMAMYNDWKSLGNGSQLHKVTIHAQISLAGFMVPDVLLEFRKEYPELEIDYVIDAHPEAYVSDDVDEPNIILGIGYPGAQISNMKEDTQNKILARGYYGCLVHRNSTIAQKSCVTFDELKGLYLVLPNGVLDGLYKDAAHVSAIDSFLPELIKTVTPKHIINVDTVGSVIELVTQHFNTYAVSFSPMHYRYRAVRSGELTNVPLSTDNTGAELHMLYSKKAFRKHPALRKLISTLESSITGFVQIQNNHEE